MVVACAPGHELAGRKQIEPEALHGRRVVTFDANLQIRREIDRVLAQRGIELQVVMEFDNTETIKRAIEIDAGIGLLPAPTVEREVTSGSLVGIPLQDDSLVRPLGIIQRRGKEQSRTTRQFVEFLLRDVSRAPDDAKRASGKRRVASGVA